MRKRYRVLLLAAIVAAVIVPVGFALSLEAEPPIAPMHAPMIIATASTAAAPALVRTEPAFADVSVPDGAKLFVVGTMLFGLAAAVRRAA